MKSNFNDDLKEAHVIENKLKTLLEDYWQCTVSTSQNKGSFSAYDLKVEFRDDTPDLTIEVKQDKMVGKTGNIAVEIGRVVNDKWRDTCLSATESDVYAYYFNDTFHLIDTPVLKELFETKQYKRICEGGDSKRARVALFPVDLILKHTVITLK